ncbi:MAG TPA: hypothetical protein VGU71_10595, partial [Candidatus Dormibacteraeota bacterium]|nr:hypothetical protein [Candidatus Dormibacteraeota bacterium]
KCETLLQAIALGVDRVRTDNDGENAPILHLNASMGYTRRTDQIQLMKPAFRTPARSIHEATPALAAPYSRALGRAVSRLGSLDRWGLGVLLVRLRALLGWPGLAGPGRDEPGAQQDGGRQDEDELLALVRLDVRLDRNQSRQHEQPRQPAGPLRTGG